MAVQQNKKSPSRRGHRRSHDALSLPPLATDSASGELHRRHHLSASGYYRGKRRTPEKQPEKETPAAAKTPPPTPSAPPAPPSPPAAG